MGDLTYNSIVGTHPRLFFRRGDRALLAANAVNWGALWTGKIKAYADTVTTNSIISDINNNWLQILCLGVVGNATAASSTTQANVYFNKIRTAALGIVNLAIPTSVTPERAYVMALALAYDFCVDEEGILSESDRTTIANRLVTAMGGLSFGSGSGPPIPAESYLTGHPAENCQPVLMGGLALKDEVGYTSGSLPTYLAKAINFWFGGDDTVTLNGVPRMDSWRHFGANGGGTKGAWYWSFGEWYASQVCLMMQNAFNSLWIAGESYIPLEDETWIGKTWRYGVNTLVRGNGDYMKWCDTALIADPVVHSCTWGHLGAMMRCGEDDTAKSIARWIWEKKRLFAEAAKNGHGYLYALTFAWVDAMSIPQANMETDCAKTFSIVPPGVVFARNTWDLPTSTKIRLDLRHHYYPAHNHLKCGTLHIEHYQDTVVGDGGEYDDYATDHHRGWQCNTISASGIVLVDDGTASPHNQTTTNATLWTTSGKPALPAGLGGQYYKQYNAGYVAGETYDRHDPQTVPNMVQQGAGKAWVCCEGSTDTDPYTVLFEDDEVMVVYSNLRRAYCLDIADYDVDDRVTLYDAKWMIIKNFGGTGRMAVFMLHRVTARQASWPKRMVWNFWDGGTTTAIPNKNLLRVTGNGYRVTPSPIIPMVAIDHYGHSSWVPTRVGASSTYNPSKAASEFIFGPTDFFYGTQNYTTFTHTSATDGSLRSLASRNIVGACRVRTEIRPANNATTHSFPVLVQPYIINNGIPDIVDYNWIDETDYYGVEVNGKAYKLHKTQAQYVSGNDPPDTTPPVVPGVPTLTTPASATIQATWTANTTDSDIHSYKVWYREKV